MFWSFDTILLTTLWVVTAGYLGIITLTRDTIFGHKNVTQAVFQTASVLLAIGVFATASAAVFAIRGNPWHAIIALPLTALFFLGVKALARPFKEIESVPPQKGLLEVWGKRFLIVFDEGKYRDADFWPFNVAINDLWVGTIPFRFLYNDVPCKAEEAQGGVGVGAFVDIEVVGSIQPDHQMDRNDGDNTEEGARRLITWTDNHGNDLYGADGTPKKEVKEGTDRTNPIMSNLDAAIGQELRKIAIQHTWERLAGIKVAIAASLVALISGTRPRVLPREENGKLKLSRFKSMAPSEYNNEDLYPTIEEPVEYILAVHEDKEELANRLKEFEVFQHMLTKSGLGDVAHLGFQINVLNVPTIDPTGAVKEATDKAAAEQKQREAERADILTEGKLAKALLEELGIQEPTYEQLQEALATVRKRRNKAPEIFINGGDPLTNAGVVAKMAGQVYASQGG